MSINVYEVGLLRMVLHADHVAEVERLTAFASQAAEDRYTLAGGLLAARAALRSLAESKDMDFVLRLAEGHMCGEAWNLKPDPVVRGRAARVRAALAALPTSTLEETE